MPRRVSLPGADELFRTTGGASLTTRQATEAAGASGAPGGAAAAAGSGAAGNGHARAVPAPSPGQDPEPEHSGAHNSAADPSGSADQPGGRPAAHQEARPVEQRTVPAPAREPGAPAAAPRAVVPRRKQRRPSGRERHDEKITVYVSAEELMDLEHARLTLRGDFGLAVDRGRIVREAIAVVLADLEARGEASILVRRLRGGPGPGH
ncbi:hypothetical protein [Yinghuangia soli]|uniref:Cobyrinic acid a,c-diamide synthase n=1 Tax=Yinghuangia soli TaxID=2908204 RepID=A0AA41Q842_9ACTN|nr:hypothetical protein [Yinghuangia soli]MCF2531927.1 hypothetical protein [Yinghuangia soli]